MRFGYFLGALFAAATFSVGAAIPASEQAEVVEFYHAGLDHYFITAEPNEIGDLDTGVHPGWARTGYRFTAIKSGSAQPGTSPMCRFYSPTLSSHFYTSKQQECEDVKVKFPEAWLFESGEVFRAFNVGSDGTCPADTVPVHRLFNQRSDVNHRYTDQLTAFQFMVGKGYLPEGDGNPALPIAFCAVAGASTVPLASADAPNCTVTASSANPAVGATLSLSAICTNNPTSFMWTGCSSNTSSCTTTKTTAGAASYTVYSSNSKGPGDPVSISVNWGGAAGVVPICTLAASTPTPTTGSMLTLSSSCSQSPTKYDWYNCNYLIQQICNPIPSCANTKASCAVYAANSGFARYAVVGTNGAGYGPQAAIDVEWKSGGGGGGGGGGGNDPIPSCTILASNSTPAIGTSIVLSASCSGNPTSFAWSGVACSGVQCSASSGTPGVQTYSLTASNAAGSSSVAYTSIEWKSSSNPTPTCTLSVSDPAPLVGTTITISSSCNNAPTGFAWTGCTSNGGTCTDSVAVAGAKQYTLTASNGAGNGNVASVSVDWKAAPTSPPACSVSASSASPTVGENVTLTASCSGSPTSYDWTNCTSTSSTCVATATAAGSQTYYVAGSNGFGKGAAAGVVVYWLPAGGGGGGGGGGGDFCGSYGNVMYTSVNWGDTTRLKTSSLGGFGPNDIVVMSFTVPSSPASYTTPGYTSMAEFNGPPTIRQATLSASACDFRPYDPTGANGPLMVSSGTQVTIDWNVGAPPISLVPGHTYYFNYRNYDTNKGGSSCSQSSCPAGFSTQWPR